MSHTDPNNPETGTPQESRSDLKLEWTSRLPENLKQYATAIGAQFSIGMEVPATLAMSVISAALGRGIEVRTTFGRTTTPNLYSVGVAETCGYKSSISEPIFGALYKCARPNPARPSGRCCTVVEDATPESLAAKAHSSGGVLASISSDANGALATLMGKYTKSGQPDVSVLLKGFSNEELRQDRIGRSSVDVRVCLSVSWLLQTHIVKALYGNRPLIDQGLLGRFLVFPFAEPVVEVPPEEIAPPTEAQAAFDNRISELVNTFYGKEEIPVISASKDARGLLTYYESVVSLQIASGHLQSIAPLAKRRAEIAWRVALVLHAFEHAANATQLEISEKTAWAALYFVGSCSRFQEELAEEAVDAAEAERLDKAMALVKYSRGGVTARDLCRKSSLFLDTASALRTLRELQSERVGIYSRPSGKSERFYWSE